MADLKLSEEQAARLDAEATPSPWGWTFQPQESASQRRATGWILGPPYLANVNELGFTNPADVELMANARALLADRETLIAENERLRAELAARDVQPGIEIMDGEVGT